MQVPALLLAIVLLAATARAEIAFSGVLIMPGRSLFALTEGPAESPAWRALGQEFAGYSLAAFEAKTDTLTLMKEGAPLRLHLKDEAKTKTARLELGGTITVGTGEKLEVTRVTLAFDQETILPLSDGLTWRITPTRLTDGNILYRLAAERVVQNGGLKSVQKISAPSVVVLPDGAFSIALGDLKFTFAPISPSP